MLEVNSCLKRRAPTPELASGACILLCSMLTAEVLKETGRLKWLLAHVRGRKGLSQRLSTAQGQGVCTRAEG